MSQRHRRARAHASSTLAWESSKRLEVAQMNRFAQSGLASTAVKKTVIGVY